MGHLGVGAKSSQWGNLGALGNKLVYGAYWGLWGAPPDWGAGSLASLVLISKCNVSHINYFNCQSLNNFLPSTIINVLMLGKIFPFLIAKVFN